MKDIIPPYSDDIIDGDQSHEGEKEGEPDIPCNLLPPQPQPPSQSGLNKDKKQLTAVNPSEERDEVEDPELKADKRDEVQQPGHPPPGCLGRKICDGNGSAQGVQRDLSGDEFSEDIEDQSGIPSYLLPPFENGSAHSHFPDNRPFFSLHADDTAAGLLIFPGDDPDGQD